jgi:hypothetical protein
MLLVQFFVSDFGAKDCYNDEHSMYTILTISLPYVQYVHIVCGHVCVHYLFFLGVKILIHFWLCMQFISMVLFTDTC